MKKNKKIPHPLHLEMYPHAVAAWDDLMQYRQALGLPADLDPGEMARQAPQLDLYCSTASQLVESLAHLTARPLIFQGRDRRVYVTPLVLDTALTLLDFLNYCGQLGIAHVQPEPLEVRKPKSKRARRKAA